jgi:Fur family transcriptional regulator, peroxide stress response regulator
MTLQDNELQKIRKLCNQAGMKLTPQRLEIYKELLSHKDHPSTELIFKQLRKRLPTISLDTVYRTLATFDEFGIIKRLNVSNARTLFDTNLDQHHHFICSRCKQVEDVYWPDFDQSTLPKSVSTRGSIQTRHLELHGICNQCLNKENNI